MQEGDRGGAAVQIHSEVTLPFSVKPQFKLLQHLPCHLLQQLQPTITFIIS